MIALARTAAAATSGPAPFRRLAALTVLQGATRRYHEAVHEHFNNPRHVGSFDKSETDVGTAIVGKASCGDVIKLQVKVEGGVIKDAKFKTFGCGSAIASSSLATDMIIGRSINEASQLKNTDISAHLSLPPVKIHCSVLAEEAVQAAIADYRKRHGETSAAQ
mmetsp:Transcript_4971/g.14565  ORF Transcript_4971/g.14565 Transcript_4971/m.14565 type:complete len:163 (-) Transcript_4971:90-578(-)